MALTDNKAVKVQLQTARATGKAITAITQAATAVVTSTAHGYANGDYVVLSNLNGMTDLLNGFFKVANVTANTFELEGVNSTSFEPYSSGGTAHKVTLGASFNTIKELNFSGGDYDEQDITTIHVNNRITRPGMGNAVKVDMVSYWDPTNSALTTVEAASKAQTEVAMLITFANLHKVALNGFVGAGLVPNVGAAGDMVTTTIKYSALGAINKYTS